MNSRPGGSDDLSDRAVRTRSGLGSRRVVGTAFAVSVAAHVLAVVLYPMVFAHLNPNAPAFFPGTTGPAQGVEVLRLIDIDPTPEPDTPDDPEEIDEVDTPAAESAAVAFEPLTGVELVPPGLTLAERLRPHLVDPRLWRPLPPELYEPTVAQREELVLADRIRSWLDSVQADQAAKDALTDWTFTDAKGGRWGISPGKIHLGDITLPLPVNFGTPVGKRDEYADLQWQWEEIMRQAARADVEYTWRERAEAIRARRDAQRSVERPDTTRRR